jgi:hypothetical protein
LCCEYIPLTCSLPTASFTSVLLDISPLITYSWKPLASDALSSCIINSWYYLLFSFVAFITIVVLYSFVILSLLFVSSTSSKRHTSGRVPAWPMWGPEFKSQFHQNKQTKIHLGLAQCLMYGRCSVYIR